MSNTLLLTVLGMAITGIILGMRIALGIIRSVPMFGGGYPPVMPATASNRTDNTGGGSVTFTFILLVFFILAVLWITTNPKYAAAVESTTIPPTTEIPQNFEGVTTEPAYVEVAKPIIVRAEPTVKRVNESPTPPAVAATMMIYYGIQVGAFTDYDRAVVLEAALAAHAATIIEEGDIYKVIIEEFSTADAAELYLAEYEELKKGFVRRVIISA